MLQNTYPFVPPPLPFPYDALEPFIDAETMRYHYDKHYKGYADKLNAALEPFTDLHDVTLARLLSDPALLPQGIRVPVTRNGGGVYNHWLYFGHLSPPESVRGPGPALLARIGEAFGSYEDFKRIFSETAASVFGSGYAFLTDSLRDGLKISALPNQDYPPPLSARPLAIFDVWEHAYYLKYKNDRAAYIQGLWNIVTFCPDERTAFPPA